MQGEAQEDYLSWVATSGDTGKAALEYSGIASIPNHRVLSAGGVSDVHYFR
jgi:threonine synthase